MKIFSILCLIWCTFPAFAQPNDNMINAILGDESYEAAFGSRPGQSADEKQRIQLHLAYTEKLLRDASVTHLTEEQRSGRAFVLDLLHEYWTAGNFPVNRAYPTERRPCFIDDDGNICAVGYLVEKTAGRELARAINSRHQYDFLLDMNEPAIAEWAEAFGLSLMECAMIQPSYAPPPPDQTNYADIKTGYGISSGIIGGTNLAINMANLSSRFRHNRTLPYLGMITGTGQVILGIVNIKRATSFSQFYGTEVYTSYKSQNNLSYANIALGTSTLLTSLLNLSIQKKMKDKRNTFNLYSQPGYSNSLAMGIHYSRQL